MNKIFGSLILTYILMSCSNHQETTEPTKPNVILFLIDDLGYSDLGCYGSKFYETPTIDSIASVGVKFTQNYSASTICSPTRAAILTGKYPGRLGITGPIPIYGYTRCENPKMMDAEYEMNLPLEEITIGDAFKEAGYTTMFLGKWHVNDDPELYPQHHGFDHVVGKEGFRFGGPASYFSPYKGRWRMTENHPWVEKQIFSDGDEGETGEYLTDRLTDEAVQLIKAHKDEPFFLDLSHYAVHAPLQGKETLIDYFKTKPADTIRRHDDVRYAAMIKSVDESLASIISALKKFNLEKNTIIMIASDNGGADLATNNWPWHGVKGNFFEGGIRVPLIVSWPGKIRQGSETDVPVISTDYYPTLLELAGLPQKPEQTLDGKSFARLLFEQPPTELENDFRNRDLYWHFPNYIGENKFEPATPSTIIRTGDWKLIQSLEDSTSVLYDLKNDPLESKDVSGENPELVSMLVQKLEDHREEQKVMMPRPNPDYQP